MIHVGHPKEDPEPYMETAETIRDPHPPLHPLTSSDVPGHYNMVPSPGPSPTYATNDHVLSAPLNTLL